VRTIKVFVIYAEYHVIVIGAMLTLDTEINVLVTSAQHRLACMFQGMMCGGVCMQTAGVRIVCGVLHITGGF